jgi:hypothetical protein
MNKGGEHWKCVNKQESSRTVIMRDSLLEISSPKEQSFSQPGGNNRY